MFLFLEETIKQNGKRERKMKKGKGKQIFRSIYVIILCAALMIAVLYGLQKAEESILRMGYGGEESAWRIF